MSETRKKRVTVSFAGDDDVLQHINSIKATKGRVRVTRQKDDTVKQSQSDSGSSEQSEEEQSNTSQNEQDQVFRPSQALAEEAGLTGGDVYGFKSVKKSTQMAAVVNRSVQVVASSSPAKPSPKPAEPTTPKSILKKSKERLLTDSNQSPSSRKPAARKLRGRNKVASSSEDSLSSESSDDADSDDSSASGVSRRSTPYKKSASQETPSEKTKSETPSGISKPKGRRTRKVDETYQQTENVEAYFDAHSTSKVLTSDRTLARLETPRMDHQALSKVLHNVQLDFLAEKEALRDEARRHFKQWMFMMCHGYNLMFHGLGSKRPLIEEFRSKMLKDMNHVVVNGYFPSLTIKTILTAITEEMLEHDGTFRNPIDQCDFIRKHFECGDHEDFFLIIHNIDGTMLRGEKTQTILSLLAQIRGFHIVASIDHINAPLMWDGNRCSRYNWLWYDVTSYEPYTEETSYENSLLVQQSGVLALSSLTHVLRSLPTNARGIFMLLVTHQMEHSKDNSGYQGLSFPDLYQKCREDFLVNSDITLRTQLTEFKDHKLIKLKKGGMDGIEYLHIPLDNATLKEFIEQQQSEDT